MLTRLGGSSSMSEWNSLERSTSQSRIKISVVFVFTLCWLITVTIRGPFMGGDTSLDGSWLLGLATQFQQGALSGRDFHFTYGIVAQIIAWLATSLTVSKSALDAYALLTVFFCGASALLVASVLLLYDQITWKQVAILYFFSAILSLFNEVASFRTVFPLLCSAFAYRSIAAETRFKEALWAAAAGFVCFAAQLSTPEVALYGLAAAISTFALKALLDRNLYPVVLALEFGAILFFSNLALVLYFSVSSPYYGAVWDYQRYALETVVSYNNTMGLKWSVDMLTTSYLVLLLIYTVSTIVRAAKRLPSTHACMLVGLLVAAVVSLKSALVRSEIGHVMYAATNLVFVFLLLSSHRWNPGRARIGWGLMLLGLVLIWPNTGLGVPRDFLKAVTGELPVTAAIRQMRTINKPPARVLPASLFLPGVGQDPVPIAPFPYENYIPIALHRPLLAPVLQSYSSGTDALQRFYVDTLERQRANGIEVVYGLDSVAAWPVDGIQAISRVPIIFDYFYRHFELTSATQNLDGHYVLHARTQPRAVHLQDLPFKANLISDRSGIVRLDQPTSCGLVRLDLKVKYSALSRFFRQSGIQVAFGRGEARTFSTPLNSPSPKEDFVTYVGLMQPSRFYQLFRNGVMVVSAWDTIRYKARPSDMFGATAQVVQVNKLECVDPALYVEGDPSKDLTDEELLFSVNGGPGQTGYAVLTSDSGPLPEVVVKIGYSQNGLQRAIADAHPAPAATEVSIALDSMSARSVGIAIVNPGRSSVHATVQFGGTAGSEYSSSIELAPGEHKSEFLNVLLPPVPLQPLSGSVIVRADHPLAIFACHFAEAQLRVLPVKSATPTADLQSVVFPQVVMNDGWATGFVLTNRATAPVSGQVTFFSAGGDVMPVMLNGTRSSQFKYKLSPGSVFKLWPGLSSGNPSQ